MTTTTRAVIESEDLLRLAADTAPALVWISDADRRCNYVNRPWLAFTGRTMEPSLAMAGPKACTPRTGQRASKSTLRRSTGDSHSGSSIGCDVTTVNIDGCR